MSKLFNTIRVSKPKLNSFDLSHEKKMSLNMGDLVPCYLAETVPGDIFSVNSEILLRMAPMLAPIMHRVNAYVHYFFVPNRLVYSNWETFITGGADGLQAPAFPTINVNDVVKTYFKKGSLGDYFGIPITPANCVGDCNVNALPFRAYQLIYNEYYRDETLQTPVPLTKNDTVNVAEIIEISLLRKRCWEKDYFTSALPFAQRGGAVSIPGTMNPDYVDTLAYQSGGLAVSADGALHVDSGNLKDSSNVDVELHNVADGMTTETLVNDMRRAVRLQEWLEKNARAGYRYIEQILSHFGVRSSDARLQRPEYLGGGKTPVTISEVLATAEGATNPIGEMVGHGISVGNSNRFKKRFEEHGFIIGILSVMPRTAYQQGIERVFTKIDKFDYFWPTFANIGEQQIYKGELYHDYTKTFDKTEFGYQSRYAEYKYQKSSVHGDFRDDLSFWHMGRIFDAEPGLNETFLKADTSAIDQRVFAVTEPNYHKLYAYLYNNVRALRPMPYFGEPTL